MSPIFVPVLVLLASLANARRELDPRESEDITDGCRLPVKEEFLEVGIVPNIFRNSPLKKCIFTWDNVAVSYLGNFVHKKRILYPPHVDFRGNRDHFYTSVMFHPDVPLNDTAFKDWYPWIVGNIPPPKNIHHGEVLWPYKMIDGPKHAGIQRHIMVVFKHKGKRNFLPEDRHQWSKYPPKFNITAFAEKYDLGDPDFGNFMYSED